MRRAVRAEQAENRTNNNLYPNPQNVLKFIVIRNTFLYVQGSSILLYTCIISLLETNGEDGIKTSGSSGSLFANRQFSIQFSPSIKSRAPYLASLHLSRPCNIYGRRGWGDTFLAPAKLLKLTPSFGISYLRKHRENGTTNKIADQITAERHTRAVKEAKHEERR